MSASLFKAAFLALAFGYSVVPTFAADDLLPILVIRQMPEYSPGRGPIYPYGLVAVVWPDGRVVRANDKMSVGAAYTEGRARPKEFSDLLQFLTSPAVLSLPDEFAVAPDSAWRSITIWHSGKKHNWARTIRGQWPILKEIETRAWSLPLEQTGNFDPKKTQTYVDSATH